MSYCHQKGLFLDSSKGIPITLHPGECNPPPPPPPPQLTNSLINNPNTLPFHNRPALELTVIDYNFQLSFELQRIEYLFFNLTAARQ